ncbi:hypothetical protein G5B31_11735 [Rhodobacter sp. SGA-6-6]|uniref:hypothetical protein n=1 Tax=Rhodobacter sp. SGA-6-6 TaxID=2710882 RepID=UPI0013EDEC70|nr:hypothetical protein [Rhodobacter sp. SGA-6-6]NGM46205.1 hypothetical protein [Rhodobacter sp. SGA-6-6]
MSRGLLPALLLAALVLRLQGLDWDQGRGLHPDEGNLVRAAAALGPGRWIPAFHAYNDLALWLPKLAAAPFCDTSAEPCLRAAARVLSALFSAVSVWAMAAIALRLAGQPAMLATALIAATSAPLIQWAHFGTTESALVLLTALLWLQALRWQRGEIGNSGLALTSALLLAAGFGIKTSALAAAVIPLAALAVTRRPLGPSLRTLAWALPLTAALALAAVPSLIFAPADWLAVMRFERGVVDGSLEVFWTRQFAAGSGPLFQLRQLWGATAGAGLALAALGLLAPADRLRGLVPGLAFALVYAGLSFGWHAAFFRYLAPLFPALLVLAGLGAARLLALPSQTARALAGAGLALMAVTGLDLAASYQATDPRVLAEAALRTRAAPGARLAVEPYDSPQTAGLETLVLPLEDPDPAALAGVLAASDWMLVASRRNWAVLPGHPAAPLACGYYAALTAGDLGWRPVALFRRASPFGPLLQPDLAAEETRSVFDRPQVILLRNEERLDAATLADRLSAPPGDCTPAALAAAWERPR